MLKRLLLFSFILFVIPITVFSYSKEISSVSNISLKSIVPKKEIRNDDLLGSIEIPKIGLKENIYSIGSNENNVDKHVTILKDSILPIDNNSSIIFLAAHSGTGRIAYFKNLNNLNIGDLVLFYYNNYKYSYQVTKSYEINKDGDIEVVKSSDNQLVLTTCSPLHKDKQLVIDAMLTKKKSL